MFTGAHTLKVLRLKMLIQLFKVKMTNTLRRSSRIARRAVNQGARPETEAHAAVEKSITGTNLLKAKNEMIIGTINFQTLQKNGKIPELIACAESTKHDIISVFKIRTQILA